MNIQKHPYFWGKTSVLLRQNIRTFEAKHPYFWTKNPGNFMPYNRGPPHNCPAIGRVPNGGDYPGCHPTLFRSALDRVGIPLPGAAVSYGSLLSAGQNDKWHANSIGRRTSVPGLLFPVFLSYPHGHKCKKKQTDKPKILAIRKKIKFFGKKTAFILRQPT